MKKFHKIKTVQNVDEPKIYCTREIDLHDLFAADSIAEAHGYIKSIHEDFDKLLIFEQEGKIKAECGSDSPSFMFVYVLDKSIFPELRKITLLSKG